MNSVPPCASSSAPALRCCVPFVCSTPNSSTSIRSGVIAAALMTTNGPLARAGQSVQRARGQFLAGARRPDDHDAAVGFGARFSIGLAKLVHARRAADQRRRCRRELLELLDLALETRGFQRAGRDQNQAVGLERLLDEVVGAALDRGDRGFDVAVTGDHHHRHFRMVALDRIEQLQARRACCPAARCRERPGSAARFAISAKRAIAVARGARAEAFVFKDAGDEVADIGLVVDDENVMCHAIHLACSPVAIRLWLLPVRPRSGRSSHRACRAMRNAGASRRRAAPGIISAASLQFDAAAVVFQNAADDRETKAGALFARRDIRLEQPAARFLRQADAVVDHIDDDVARHRAPAMTSMRPLSERLGRHGMRWLRSRS